MTDEDLPPDPADSTTFDPLAAADNSAQMVELAAAVRAQALAMGFSETEAGAMAVTYFQQVVTMVFSTAAAETIRKGQLGL